MADILKLFSPKIVLDYLKNRTYPAMLGDMLFPTRKVESLEFEILSAGIRVPVAASVHAFDAESEIGSREAQKSAQELGFIKRKIALKEKDLIALRNPRTAAEQNYLEGLVYADIDNMVQSVLARIEIMRMEMISTGKVTVVENGLDLVIDYFVPTEHQATLTDTGLWSDTSSSPIENIQTWASALDIKPTRALTSNTVLLTLLRHPEMQALFKQIGQIPTAGNLNLLLQSYGLPVIATYDEKYRKQGADGTFTRSRYFPEDHFVMFNSEVQGETIYGPTPEESRLLSGGSTDHKVGNIFACVYEESLDPVSTWTKACATAMPSFAEAENVFQASVIAPSTGA